MKATQRINPLNQQKIRNKSEVTIKTNLPKSLRNKSFVGSSIVIYVIPGLNYTVLLELN